MEFRTVAPRIFGLLIGIGLCCAVGNAATSENVPLQRCGYEPTIEGVRRCLELFSPDAAEHAKVLGHIGLLGDDRFVVRQNASEALLRLPILPVAELKRAANGRNPEAAYRARRILAQRKSDDDQYILKTALDTIAQRKLQGMAADVIRAVKHVRSDSLWQSVVDAIAATAKEQDRDLLTKALSHDRPVARAAAVYAITIVLDAEAVELLKPMLDDPDDRVVLAAARGLGDLGNRACLNALVKLLDSTHARVRLEAVQSLRWLTQQKFGYYSGDADDERIPAVKAWHDWIAKNGAAAKLRYPIETTGEIALFNGRDLNGWKLVVSGRLMDDKTAAQTCKVTDGVVSLGGVSSGYLRTEREFRNYRLSLQYRWPEGATGCDGGIHLLQTGPDASMPNCVELQTHMGNAGDFYAIGGFRVGPGGSLRTGARSRLADSSEKPSGQWNRVDVEVRNGTVAVTINGVLQNKATGCPAVPSKIAFRIERYPFSVRNVQLLPLGSD